MSTTRKNHQWMAFNGKYNNPCTSNAKCGFCGKHPLMVSVSYNTETSITNYCLTCSEILIEEYTEDTKDHPLVDPHIRI